MITITDLQKQLLGNIILKGLAELEKELHSGKYIIFNKGDKEREGIS